MTEFSLHQRHKCEGYGSLRGVLSAADKGTTDAAELPEESVEEGLGECEGCLPTPCPYCGGLHWKWGFHIKPFAWIPVGWAGNSKPRARPPPGGRQSLRGRYGKESTNCCACSGQEAFEKGSASPSVTAEHGR
jgi:hypothetical protein